MIAFQRQPFPDTRKILRGRKIETESVDRTIQMLGEVGMGENPLSLESRIAQLESQVLELNSRVAEITELLKKPREAAIGSASILPTSPSVENDDASEELLTWVGESSLLPRIATICFILVLALILRTLTDNNLLDKPIGSLLGMGYAAALIFLGWHRYGRSSPLAPVFTLFGSLLMFSIVLETHAHFEVLPSVPAYLVLMFTGTGTAAISFRYKNSLPILVGTLGMCIAAVAVDFPNPTFPYLGILLLLANLLGFFSSRLGKCAWLRWTLLGLTLFMLQVWVIKLGAAPVLSDQPMAGLAEDWLLPAVLLFAMAYLGMALAGLTRNAREKVSKFDFLLPALYVAWAYLAARNFLLTSGRGTEISIGLVGAMSAALLFGIALVLAGRGGSEAPGPTSFVLGGSVLLALSLPSVGGNSTVTLPVLSLAALGLAVLSHRWRRDGVRAISYLLQLYSCGLLVQLLRGSSPPPSPWLATIAAGIVAGSGLLHFRWCRNHAPRPGPGIFSRYDPEDRVAVLLFMAFLVSGFFMFRTAIFQSLALVSSPEATSLFRCSQTVLINVAAAALALFALVRRNKEVRNIAILITLIGAVRVFLYDLFGTHGFPLVASVFSFGIVVTLESVALSRWQRIASGEKGKAVGQGSTELG
jgi:uncharacterized membrane protein